jgi:hypothetical protein
MNHNFFGYLKIPDRVKLNFIQFDFFKYSIEWDWIAIIIFIQKFSGIYRRDFKKWIGDEEETFYINAASFAANHAVHFLNQNRSPKVLLEFDA